MRIPLLPSFRTSLRLNCCALLDVVTHGSGPNVSVHQQEDILALGKLLLALTNISTLAIQNVPKALDVLARSYSDELKNFVLFLLGNPPPGMGKTIEDVLQLLGPHILADLDAAHAVNDLLESDMAKELENGRLVRLMTKFGFINERPECVSLLPARAVGRRPDRASPHARAKQVRPRPALVRVGRPLHHQAVPRPRLPPGRRGQPAGARPEPRPDVPQQGPPGLDRFLSPRRVPRR